MTAPTPIPVYVGDDWSLAFAYAVSGSPFNLTGFTIRAEFYQNFSATPHDLTIDNDGVTITDAAAGKFKIFVARAVTSAVKPDPSPGSGASRIQVILVDGEGLYQTIGIYPLQVIAP